MKRVVIKHLSGSKARQESVFELAQLTSITFGRDPASTVVLDAGSSDAVSRNHARLDRIPGETPAFQLFDLGSRNGTLVNGAKLTGSGPLRHGDVVQLGLEGPSFKFCLDPEPTNVLPETREVARAAALAPTREVQAPGSAPQRVLIRILTGARAHHEEAFGISSLREITFGRDTGANVVFDAERDDAVSRIHARIRPADKAGEFLLADLDSRNGVSLNGTRVSSSAGIRHGDRVQLGTDGPEFVFQLDPAPAAGIPATRFVEQRSPSLPPTVQDSALPAAQGTAPMGPGWAPVAQSPARPVAFAAAQGAQVPAPVASALARTQPAAKGPNALRLGVVFGAVTAIALGAFLGVKSWLGPSTVGPVVPAPTGAAVPAASAAPKAPSKKMSPTEIHEAYGKATVKVFVAWTLITDDPAEAPVSLVKFKGKTVYVQQPDGSMTPALFASAPNQNPKDPIQFKPVGYETSGSGSLVDSQTGHILSNRHVAAPWSEPYPRDRLRPGVLYDRNTRAFRDLTSDEMQAIPDWVPSKRQVGSDGFSREVGACRGRTGKFEVTFASTKERINATLVKSSPEHDVALIKVDVPSDVRTVTLADETRDGAAKVGDYVVALGFPAYSENTVVRVQSQDPLNRAGGETLDVPTPTLVAGPIGKHRRTGGSGVTLAGPADIYELSFQVGPGYSGGPLFNEQGLVIGIVYAGNDQSTVAVPIKYGRDLEGVREADVEAK